MDINELKEFIKNNIEIKIEFLNKYDVGFDQTVGLKFKDDNECFTMDVIYINND